MASPSLAAAILLIPALPIALWAAWSDLARMKIPNQAVIALAVAFALVGPAVLPFSDYLWRWLHLVVVLVAGFAGASARAFGAGDAKFAAAAAPFVAPGDVTFMLYLLAATMLAALVAHRAMRAFPPFRNAVPHWESWTRADFPLGLALGGALILYLAAAALWGR